MRKSAASTCAGILTLISALLAVQVSAQENQAPAETRAVRQDLMKQPVFLFCPHKESAGSWSLYLIVDRNDPARPLAIGLEELAGKNSKELTYNGVLAAQNDPSTPRRMIAQLNVLDFASGKLEVKENNMLSIQVAEVSEGLKLTIDARVSLDGRFIVGGTQQNHRSLMLQFDSASGRWQTQALRLENANGQNVVGRSGLTLTGIVFSAGATSVSRIAAVAPSGKAVILMDR